MKILHLPTSVGGNSWGLSRAERELGLNSSVLITQQNWLQYQYDICLNLNKYHIVGNLLKRIKTFLDIRSSYDIFHFNFGSSLIDFKNSGLYLSDLPYYKGKKIFTYNGCDARQKFPTIKRVEFSACHQNMCYGGICNNGKSDNLKKKKIIKVNKYADHIFSLNPDLMHFLPQNKTTFLPYTISGWDNCISHNFKIDNKIKILHSPTNREAKGSSYILKALNNIKKKYSNIEIDLIENIPHQEALIKYQKAHIVIDQLLIGWYGAFGVEVMKMGKPLAVFIRKNDLKFIPTEMAKDLSEAIININPFNIEEVLEKYIQNIHLLKNKSAAGIDYVNKWHNPLYVAGITKSIYER